MITLIFSDEIVNATELKNRQRYWLDKASSIPVTVTHGSRKLTIVDRNTIRNLYLQKFYSGLTIKYCEELLKHEASSTFPWLEFLDNEEKAEFHNELIEGVIEAMSNDDWSRIGELIDDWKATAETKSSPDVVKALTTETDPNDFVSIE